jgi:hypothetical protein
MRLEAEGHGEVVQHLHSPGAGHVPVPERRIGECRLRVGGPQEGEGHVVGVRPFPIVPVDIVPQPERELRPVLAQEPRLREVGLRDQLLVQPYQRHETNELLVLVRAVVDGRECVHSVDHLGDPAHHGGPSKPRVLGHPPSARGYERIHRSHGPLAERVRSGGLGSGRRSVTTTGDERDECDEECETSHGVSGATSTPGKHSAPGDRREESWGRHRIQTCRRRRPHASRPAPRPRSRRSRPR